MKPTPSHLIILLAILAVFLLAAWTPSGRARTSPNATPTAAAQPAQRLPSGLADQQLVAPRCENGVCPPSTTEPAIEPTHQPIVDDFGYPVETTQYPYP